MYQRHLQLIKSTDFLTSSPLTTPSTYPLVAASVSALGDATLVIFALETSTVPVPFGSNTMLPFEFVDDTVLPSSVRLSTSRDVIPFKSVCVPPSATASEPIVTELFASLEFAIEPASCVEETPPALILTAPDETSKSAEAKDAIPLLDAVASSPAIVIALFATVVSIPSPPKNVRVSPVLNVSLEPLSAASVNDVETEPNESVPEPFVLETGQQNHLHLVR